MSRPASREPLEIVQCALDRARDAGADAADAILLQSENLAARVRGDEIDFVKQARERILGIRALVRGPGGARSAITSTSDLSAQAIERMAGEALALARATAEDPAAGLPEEASAADWRGLDLGLGAAGDRGISVEARIEDARRAEAAARATDARIANSEGSQAESDFAHVAYGNSLGFLGEYDTAFHSLFSEPIARDGGYMQRDYWMSVAHRLSELEDAASLGRRAAERALRRLGARRIATCEVPVIFDALTAPSLLRQLAACISGYAIYRQSSFLAGRLGERVASPLV
ncbi:MAG TPA: metallopeptidase TldD-related protein, partial [Myxococcota bacterium]